MPVHIFLHFRTWTAIHIIVSSMTEANYVGQYTEFVAALPARAMKLKYPSESAETSATQLGGL